MGGDRPEKWALVAVPAVYRVPGSNWSSEVALKRLKLDQDNLTSPRTNVHSFAISPASNINKHFEPAAGAPAGNPSTHAAEAKDYCKLEASQGCIVSPSQLQSKTLSLSVFEIYLTVNVHIECRCLPSYFKRFCYYHLMS